MQAYGVIGDPYGGVAYGERNMPVVVVAAAVGSMAAGVAAFTAATTMMGMIAAGAMIAGGALTIIGTVTGNEKLTKIGGIVSLVGGIGTIANNMISAAGSTAAEAAAGSAAADAAGGTAGELGGSLGATDLTGGVAGAELGGEAVTGAAGSGGGGLIDSAAGTAAEGAGQAAGQVATQAATEAATQAATPTLTNMSGFQTGAIDPFAASVNPVQSAFSASDLAATSMNTGMPGLTDAGALAAGSAPAPGGLINSISGFAKDNPELLKLGAGAITGLVPTNKTQAETEYANAAAERQRQATEEARLRQLWRQGRTS